MLLIPFFHLHWISPVNSQRRLRMLRHSETADQSVSQSVTTLRTDYAFFLAPSSFFLPWLWADLWPPLRDANRIVTGTAIAAVAAVDEALSKISFSFYINAKGFTLTVWSVEMVVAVVTDHHTVLFGDDLISQCPAVHSWSAVWSMAHCGDMVAALISRWWNERRWVVISVLMRCIANCPTRLK